MPTRNFPDVLFPSCTSIPLNVTTGGLAATVGYLNSGPGTLALSGALTANTFKSMVDLSGQGFLNFVAHYAGDTTARTMGIRVTIDGVVVATQTSQSISTTNSGIVIGAALSSVASVLVPFGLYRFNQSLKIEIKSSLTETDKSTVNYAYQLG